MGWIWHKSEIQLQWFPILFPHSHSAVDVFLRGAFFFLNCGTDGDVISLNYILSHII